MRCVHILAVAVTCLCVAAGGASAGVSFDGSSQSTSSGYLIVESSIDTRIDHGSPIDKGSVRLGGQVGYMHRTGERTAWGGAATMSSNGEAEVSYGVLVRHRRWLNESWALDAGAGVYLWESGRPGIEPSPLFQLALSPSDWIAFHAGVDVVQRSYPDLHAEPYVGVRFGKWLAPATAAMIGLGAAAF